MKTYEGQIDEYFKTVTPNEVVELFKQIDYKFKEKKMRSELFEQALEGVPEHTTLKVKLYLDLIDEIIDRGYMPSELAELAEVGPGDWFTLEGILKMSAYLGTPLLTVNNVSCTK